MVHAQSEKIGKVGMWSIEGLLVCVEIKDVRASFGRIDYEIEPVNGSGMKWVDAVKVKLS